MRTSINQKPIPLRLPELRNLGTVLRIVLAVNGAAFLAALAREPRWARVPAAWLDIAAVIEPPLLVSLLALYSLAPWLERRPYRLAAPAVLAISVAATFAVDVLFAALGTEIDAAEMLRHALLTALIAAALLFYFELRAKALSPAISEARLQVLQARIRPHFLFNSINAVLSLVRREPRRAETALEDMADLFRVLMSDNRHLAPLADEVRLCQQYLELEKLRLGERLTVEWHIENMPGDALVPPLLLQPLLENAVYHGIEASSAPGVIAINIFLRRGELHAILRNPYQLVGNHHAGNKMAMDNIRERLALHFDAEASLESKVNRDTYEVHIRMPYRSGSEPEDAHV